MRIRYKKWDFFLVSRFFCSFQVSYTWVPSCTNGWQRHNTLPPWWPTLIQDSRMTPTFSTEILVRNLCTVIPHKNFSWFICNPLHSIHGTNMSHKLLMIQCPTKPSCHNVPQTPHESIPTKPSCHNVPQTPHDSIPTKPSWHNVPKTPHDTMSRKTLMILFPQTLMLQCPWKHLVVHVLWFDIKNKSMWL